MYGRQLSAAVIELQAGTQHRILLIPELPAVGPDRHVVLGLVLDQPRSVVSPRSSRLIIVPYFFCIFTVKLADHRQQRPAIYEFNTSFLRRDTTVDLCLYNTVALLVVLSFQPSLIRHKILSVTVVSINS